MTKVQDAELFRRALKACAGIEEEDFVTYVCEKYGLMERDY